MTIAQIRRDHLELENRLEREYTSRIFWALRKSKAKFYKVLREDGLLFAYANVRGLIDAAPIRRVLLAIYDKVSKKTLTLEVKGFGFSGVWYESVEQWLSTFLEPMITRMNDYTIRLVLDRIAKGLKDGDSYDIIIKDLQASGIDRNRARVIARTETNRTMAWAKYDSIAALPYEAEVVWIAARDKRTRGAEPGAKADHFHMNGKVVDYLEPFTDPISGSQLLFPGDTSLGAGAGDVINCRCTIAVRRKKGGEAKPVGALPKLPVRPVINLPTIPTPEQIIPKFVPAKNIKEAKDYSLNVLKLKYADFKGVHIDIANEMNESIFKHQQVMPDIRTFGVGSAQQANRAIKSDFEEWFKTTKRYDSFVTTHGKDFANEAAKIQAGRVVSNVGNGVIAWSTNRSSVTVSSGETFDMSKYLGVYVNDKLTKDPKIINDIVLRNSEAKWFTKDVKGFGYIMNHELGHEIDKTINVKGNPLFIEIFNREKAKGIQNLTDNLSKYGATAGGNAKHLKDEMIAEAWAEFLTSPTPRPLAKEIGELILKEYHTSKNINVDYQTWAQSILKIIKP